MQWRNLLRNMASERRFGQEWLRRRGDECTEGELSVSADAQNAGAVNRGSASVENRVCSADDDFAVARHATLCGEMRGNSTS
jgi:hypothetical protein